MISRRSRYSIDLIVLTENAAGRHAHASAGPSFGKEDPADQACLRIARPPSARNTGNNAG